MIFEYEDALQCDKHPDMAFIVIVDNDGQAHTHRHVSMPTMVRVLADVVDQGRAQIAREALQHGNSA